MGPYGSVGAHIKNGESSMAQDHFKTPPDPKKDHGMTKHPQKNKKSSRFSKITKEIGCGLGPHTGII